MSSKAINEYQNQIHYKIHQTLNFQTSAETGSAKTPWQILVGMRAEIPYHTNISILVKTRKYQKSHHSACSQEICKPNLFILEV